ncbi:MAG: proprotein convertase P-domain-containing protein [Planctomycetota bacterium]
MSHNQDRFRRAVVLLIVLGLVPAWLWAMPPAPPNDDPVNAEVIGPSVPILVYGTTVLANDSITTTTLPAPVNDVDGPDVFYSFTPTTTDVFRIHLHPWQKAPLRSSDRRFTIYVYDSDGFFLDGAYAPGSARPVYFDVNLAASQTYTIGVDYNATTYDNFPFTLVVDVLPATAPDNCGDVVDLAAPLPAITVNNIDGAVNDYAFVQGTGRCAVSGSPPTTAPGIDHVYRFAAPADGDYAVELVSSGFDGVLYVNDSCPPVFPGGCLGASNHSTSGTSGAKHELIVVTLFAGLEYYIYVDNGSTTVNTGGYVLIIDDAFEYEISEVEPNDDPIAASPLFVPLNGGQLAGPLDEDWYAVEGLTGDRVYAWVNNGGSANSTLDTDLGFYGPDGVTLIEFDDEDGDGYSSPLNDLHYLYSTTSAVIAGGRLVADGTHYLRVTDQSVTGTVHRYRFHVGVEPATRNPLVECEPNDFFAAADLTGKHYYAGAIATDGDSDFYAFEATVGDRVFVALDGDPERDADGSLAPADDPNAFAGKLVVYDPAGDILISDISDSNSIQSAPDYPAQGGFFFARTTGTHYVEVLQGAASQVGSTRTYELAVFLNDAAPALAEDTDPVLALYPDYDNDVIDVTVTDNTRADSGICDVELVNSTNLEIQNLNFTPGDGEVTFTIAPINPLEGGIGKLRVFDCEGNTACTIVIIDIDNPICDGYNFSNRSPISLQDPIHVTDNDLTGINGEIEITEPGLISDVNVTVGRIDALDTGDLDIFLVSPTGTSVELVTDRMSSLGIDMVDATFDDDAYELIPILSSAAPFTGTWLPEDPAGLAQLIGEDAQGTWRLNVIDDDSSEGFGATLVSWSLDINAGFGGPETYAGTASDTTGFDAGIQSIVLTDAVNTQLNLPPDFLPGDPIVEYTVTLGDPTQNGSGTVTVTDMQENTCVVAVALSPFANTPPQNTGEITTELTIKQEVQEVVPQSDLAGVVSVINVPDSFTIGEVEVALMVDAENQGRLAVNLSHGGEFAALVNRIGMEERASSGNTKNSFDVLLDDDAPQADDIHEEPALGTDVTLGLHQPDGRGEFFGDGISTDKRDNLLFKLAGLDSAGDWEMLVADTRMMSASDNIFRRWALTLKNPSGPQRYVGRAVDPVPGGGICNVGLADSVVNLILVTSYTPGDRVVDYRVELVDPSQPGNGMLEITDCDGGTIIVPIELAPAITDTHAPIISGEVDPMTFKFNGVATDNQVDDTGIAAVELTPFSHNLEIVSVDPDPPNGAASVDFVVGLIDPFLNGRGYVRVTDVRGWRSYALVEIDLLPPVCTGYVGHTKRYVSTHAPLPIPDYNEQGVVSSITVPDDDIISDVNITLNITHGYDDDIDLTLISPPQTTLFTDIGSYGNDFRDTVLDDEADAPIPDSATEAPFTGSYQPEAGPVLAGLDGNPAAGAWNLKVVDDKTNDTGTIDSWSVTIESATFPERYDGRSEDSETHDLGICTIELLPGSSGLTLSTDAFMPGDTIVRYSVALLSPVIDGSGTVRVTDCGGNFCDIPVVLDAFEPGLGDMNCDGNVNAYDIDGFICALSPSCDYESIYPDCDRMLADINGDGYPNSYDIDGFIALVGGGG